MSDIGDFPMPPGSSPGGGTNPTSEGRAAGPKVSPHVTPPKGNGPQTSPGANSAQNGTRPKTDPFQQGPQFGAPRQQQQQRTINPKLVIDFEKLLSCGADTSSFNTLTIGIIMNGIGHKVNQQVTNVKWHGNIGVYEAVLGRLTVYYVTGLGRRDSPIYKIPEHVLPMNPYVYATQGNILTQAVCQQFNNQSDPNSSYIVIFEDDVDQHRDALAYLIAKCAFPEIDFAVKLTEDQYTNPNAGFNIIDTKFSNGGFSDEIREFCSENSVSALQTPATDCVALVINNNQMGGAFGAFNPFGGGGFNSGPFGNNFNPAFSGMGGQGFNPFGGGGFNSGPFGGNNGGFGINSYGVKQDNSFVLAALKYHIKQVDVNGYKRPIVHVTEIIENRGMVVEGFIKQFLLHFIMHGYGIAFDIEIAKLTPDIRNQLTTYLTSNFGMYGDTPGVIFHDIISYVHPESTRRVRFHPKYLTLKLFEKMHPDLAKMDKFPKSISSQEDAQRFEDFKAKAGYVQVLGVGDVHLIFNDGGAQYLMNERSKRQYAANFNMTLEELNQYYEEMMKEQQQNPNRQNQQTPFGGGGFNSGPFGNNFNPAFSGMGGQGFNPFGGGGFNSGPFGGMGYSQPGFGPQQPMYGNQYVGNAPYPGQGQGNIKGQKNQKGAHNPYAAYSQYPGQGYSQPGFGPQQPMYGNQYVGNAPYPGQGYPPGAPYMGGGYNPSMAGGAFPGAHAPQGSRYVPS